MTRFPLLLAVLTALLLSGGLRAQVSDTAAVRALAMVRERASPTLATAFLVQEARRRSPRELDALADSLVAIATSSRRGDPVAKLRVASAALQALAASGSPAGLAERTQRLAERGMPAAVAYPRAFEMLVKVFEGTEEPGLKASSLGSLFRLGDNARAVAFLGDVATRPHRVATAAVNYLSRAGEPGLAMLSRLFARDLVVDPSARQRLAALASVHGWRP